MTTETTETTTVDPQARELWDAVVEATYAGTPEEGVDCEWDECLHPWEECDADCMCEGDPLVSSFHYLREDNLEQIVERISAAYAYSKELPFEQLPVLDEDEPAMDIRSYYNAVIDTADCDELTGEDEKLVGEVAEWMEEWLDYSKENWD